MSIVLIINEVFIILLVSLSFFLIYSITKFFHIAHAAIITSCPYFVVFFLNKLSITFPISIVLAISVSTICGILCEIFIYGLMRKKNFPALTFLIASLGLYIILQNIISLCFGDNSQNINASEVTVSNQIFGLYISTIQIITILVSLTLFITIYLFLHFTLTGNSIRAVASNPELCNIYGISSDKIILIVFGIGSALAAIAGLLSSMDTEMTPTFGFNLLLYGIVAMVIGGVGSTKGLVAGSFFVATTQYFAAYYINTKWMDAVTYIILILFLIWKPLGFSGKRLKKVEV